MKKAISLLLSLAFVGLLLTACGSDPAPTGGDPQTQLQTIVITEPVRGYHWAPVYLAETLGYLEEVGLQADFQTVSGADSSEPVFSGDAQFGLRGVEMALMANEAGRGCKILVSTTTRYPYQLIGANETYSTVESLRGQVIAGGIGAASAPYAFSKAILLHAGMTPEVDASVISMASSAYLAAIQSGEIQAAVATNPWAAKALLDQGGVVIVDGYDQAVMEDLMGTDTYELFMLFSSDAYIGESPETVQKLVTAVAKAMAWMENASPEEIAQNLEPLFEGRYQELLYSAQVDKERGIASATGYHSDTGFAAAKALTKLSGAITGDAAADEIYDESFLDLAWGELSQAAE